MQAKKPIGGRTGLGLIGIALLIAIAMGLYVFDGGSVVIWLFLIPGLLIVMGTMLIFSDAIEVFLSVDDEMKDWPNLLEEDIAALKRGRLTRGTATFLISSLTAILLTYLMLTYHKLDATWGPIPVVLVAFVVVLFVLTIGIRTDWFQYRHWRSSLWIFSIALAGIIMSTAAGIYFTEPVEIGGPSQSQVDGKGAAITSAPVYETRSSHIVIFSNYTSGGSFHMPSSCTGKCGEGLIVLVVIIIVIACICASAFIAHFWVVAGWLLWTIMFLYSLRELFYSESKYSYLKS